MTKNTIDFIGGLGNQLFQYAFYVYVKNMYPKDDISVFTERYNIINDNKGFQLDSYFDLDFSFTSKKEVNKITRGEGFLSRCINKVLGYKENYIIEREDCFIDSSNYKSRLNSDHFYRGLWQDYRYALAYRDEIVKSLKFNFSDDELVFLNNIVNNSSIPTISLHVRRGDYYSNDKYKDILGNICDQSYYENSLEFIRNQLQSKFSILVFSDDIQWVKDNYKFLEKFDVKYLEGFTDKQDLYLMSICQHNIICNSTFSWWGAWLNNNSGKIVVMPSFWFKNVKSNKYQVPGWKAF